MLVSVLLLTVRRQNIRLAVSILFSVITLQLQAPWSKRSGYSEVSSLYPANFFRRNKSILCQQHTSESLSFPSLTHPLFHSFPLFFLSFSASFSRFLFTYLQQNTNTGSVNNTLLTGYTVRFSQRLGCVLPSSGI
jgi:hypothetical protein